MLLKYPPTGFDCIRVILRSFAVKAFDTSLNPLPIRGGKG